jgi:hypothetical protein
VKEIFATDERRMDTDEIGFEIEEVKVFLATDFADCTDGIEDWLTRRHGIRGGRIILVERLDLNSYLRALRVSA